MEASIKCCKEYEDNHFVNLAIDSDLIDNMAEEISVLEIVSSTNNIDNGGGSGSRKVEANYNPSTFRNQSGANITGSDGSLPEREMEQIKPFQECAQCRMRHIYN